MANNFYEGFDMSYPQIAVLAQKCSKFSPGVQPFYIPSLMAYRSNTVKNDNPVPLNNSGLLNDNKNIGLSNYTLGSVIKLYIPQQVCLWAPTDDKYIMQEGLQFLISFAGGDINKPYIIGGAWDA